MAIKQIPHMHYDSVAELKADIDRPWQLARNGTRAKDYVTDNHGGLSWYGVPHIDAMHKALAEGHSKGAESIDAMLLQIDAKLPKAVGIGRKLVRGDQGDELDIHVVNRGDVSRAWSSRRRLIKRGKSAVRIVCDIAGNCSVDSSTLQWRGVAALTVAEIMTVAGYKSEIVAAFNTLQPASGVPSVLTTVTVKPMGTSADKGLLAATLCLSGFFRTWGFVSIIRHADNAGKEADVGLGHSGKADGVVPADARFTQIVVPHDVRDLNSAAKWIVSTVQLLQAVKGVR